MRSEGGQILRMQPHNDDYFCPVDFAVSLRDNMLSLGIAVNEKSAGQDAVSTYVGHKTLNESSTPGELVSYLEEVFVTS